MSSLEKTIARTFLEMAEGLESGSFGVKPKIALTGMGSAPMVRSVRVAVTTTLQRANPSSRVTVSQPWCRASMRRDVGDW